MLEPPPSPLSIIVFYLNIAATGLHFLWFNNPTHWIFFIFIHLSMQMTTASPIALHLAAGPIAAALIIIMNFFFIVLIL